jgi:hypothetical protein
LFTLFECHQVACSWFLRLLKSGGSARPREQILDACVLCEFEQQARSDLGTAQRHSSRRGGRSYTSARNFLGSAIIIVRDRRLLLASRSFRFEDAPGHWVQLAVNNGE